MEDINIVTPKKVIKLERYSYSKIDVYKQCKFKFKLRYLDKHYIFNANIAVEFGTAIHQAEEAIALAIKNNQQIDYPTLKNKFIIKNHELSQKYPEYDLPDGKIGNRTYRDKMYEYLEHGIYRLENFMKANPTYKIVGIEQKFDFPYNDKYSFNGSIDRVILDESTGRYIIQDIKSWAEPKTAAELKAPLQFAVYAMAAAQLYNITADQISCEYDLPLCNMIQKSPCKNFITEGRPKLDALFKGIEEQDFHPTVSALCHWCEFCPTNPNQPQEGKNLCPYHSCWTKKGDTVKSAIMHWQGLENHEAVLENYKHITKELTKGGEA